MRSQSLSTAAHYVVSDVRDSPGFWKSLGLPSSALFLV